MENKEFIINQSLINSIVKSIKTINNALPIIQSAQQDQAISNVASLISNSLYMIRRILVKLEEKENVN